MEPWYKVATLRKEVREGRSFSPDEFAIALEQVVAGTVPEDYRNPVQFFARTCFTRALKEHAGMVLRRLAGETQNSAPVLTLITQFGGGKTHTLTALYHLARAGAGSTGMLGVSDLLSEGGLEEVPDARVGVFVGNAWDPEEGRETPWIDLARQVAGGAGVDALGATARSAPPGTEALGRVFAAADAPVLLLFDEVLNFVNRHRSMAESFHAFIQNLTVAATGARQVAAVVSLPRSQVEMTDWDRQWQDRITKVVRRVARDLIANDEGEIGEVVRRRLFEDLGDERVRKGVARIHADWCFKRTARLPPEWLAVDSARTERKAKEFLRGRFESCYPFHPATLSVFQRKWRALAQFQQTRGALAMLAQWISQAGRDQFKKARREPLITLGSAPLDAPAFRAVVLGQLGEARLDAAIEADLAGPTAHARALDVEAKGAFRDLHRRVGTAILFESSGGQVDKTAHLPELRFALGEPEVDTATIDSAAADLEKRGFFIRKVGTDGYRIHHQATLKKAVSDRRASLDEDTEIRPATAKLVKGAFTHGSTLPVVPHPEDSTSIPDSPRLTIVVVDPETEWQDDSPTDSRILDWTRTRGGSPRLYPGALIWCGKRPGHALHDKVAHWLAWRRVAQEVAEGVLGTEVDLVEVQSWVKEAEDAAHDEVWASYRLVALADAKAESGLRVLDLGAGHASASETLCGRIVTALKTEALLNDTVGAGYIDRHWPPALNESGAWPLKGLRQSFLDGSLTRLLDPDIELRRRIVDFVAGGTFGLASGPKDDGRYERLWFAERVGPEEVAFEASVFLLRKTTAEALRTPPATEEPGQPTGPKPGPKPGPSGPGPDPLPPPDTEPSPGTKRTATLCLTGTVPPETWNRLGMKVLPKLRSGENLRLEINLSVTVGSASARSLQAELDQILDDLSLEGKVRIERS